MAEDIIIGDGIIIIRPDVDENGLRADARRAGNDYEREFSRAASGSADNDTAIRRAFTRIGTSIRSGLATIFTGILPVIGAASNAVLAFGPIVAHAALALKDFTSSALAAAPALVALGVETKIAMAVIKLFLPAIGQSLMPIKTAFDAATASAAKFATAGLTPLANQFVKLNMGNISNMLDRIAIATNGVVTSFLNWTNTAEGVGAIEAITRSTSSLVEHIAPWISAVAKSFVAMLGRIAKVSSALGDQGLAFVLKHVKDILDSITEKSVTAGLDSLKKTFDSIRKTVENTITVFSALFKFYQKFKTEISLVSDVLGVLAIAFGGPITATIAAIGLVIRHFDQLKALVSGAGGWFSGIPGGTAIIQKLKDGALELWDSLKKAFTTIKDAVQGPLATLATTIQTQLLPALGNFLVAVEPIANLLINILGPAIATIASGFLFYLNILLKVLSYELQFYTFILNLLPQIGPAIAGFFGYLASIPGMIWNAITSFISTSLSAIAGWISSAAGFFQSLPGLIGNALAALPGIVAAAFVLMASSMLYQVGYAIGATVKFFIDLPGRAAAGVAALWGAITGAFTTAKDGMSTAISTAASSVVAFFTALPGRAAAAVASLWSAISGAFASAKSNAIAGVTALVTGTITFLATLPGKAKSALAAVPGQIKAAFSGADGWLLSAGAQILAGLVQGMKGAVGAAVNAAVGAAKSVINGLKSGLGIASPSKVAEEEVGAYVMPGVAKGITKSMPEFQTTIQGVAPATATAAVASVAPSTASTSGGTQIGTLNVELKGVLDPTDPAALRRLIANLYEELAKYERSYA